MIKTIITISTACKSENVAPFSERAPPRRFPKYFAALPKQTRKFPWRLCLHPIVFFLRCCRACEESKYGRNGSRLFSDLGVVNSILLGVAVEISRYRTEGSVTPSPWK